MTRELSPYILGKLTEWEGLMLRAYKDSVGVWTIGVGHTSNAGPPKVTEGMTITKEQALVILNDDLLPVRQCVEGAVKVKLNDNQFGILCSLCFNIGNGAFLKSTLLKKLNSGDYAGVPGSLIQWNKGTINGKLVLIQGLVNRRAKEVQVWNTPVVDEPSAENAVVVSPSPQPTVPQSPKANPFVSLLLSILQALFGKK